jgi:hypothetical protein
MYNAAPSAVRPERRQLVIGPIQQARGPQMRMVRTAHVGCVVPCPRVEQVPISWRHFQIGSVEWCWPGTGWWQRDVPHSNTGDGSILERAKEAHHLPINLEWVTVGWTHWTIRHTFGCFETKAGDNAAIHCSKHAAEPLVSAVKDSDLPIWSAAQPVVAPVHLLSAPFERDLQTAGHVCALRTIFGGMAGNTAGTSHWM